MAVKPSLDPKWSTSNNPLDNIEPTESLKIGGVPAGGVWGREFLNWQFYAISQWIDWVRSSALDKDNNLSDLTNTATARTNLGLNNASVTLGANTTGGAAKWTTARTITLGGDLSGSVAIDGGSDVALSAQVGDDSHSHSASTLTAATTSVAGVTQLNDTVTSTSTTQAATANAARLAYNRAAEYAPSKTGTNASGTWGINVTGNAGSATKLQTARTIGGVSFDGTANINLPGVNTAGNQSTSGNAATATKLATARTINGTSFDGSANITTANWGTARTITIAGSGKSVNGSGGVTWSLADLKLDAALAGNGWQKLPSGLIIQWGSNSVGSNTTASVTLPIAFPTACRSVIPNAQRNDVGGAENISAFSFLTTGFTLVNGWGATTTFNWIAIGY